MTTTTEPTTTPAPLSARLATMAEQLRGFISPSDLSSADRAELSALASALTAASQDAARLEAPARIVCEVEDGLLQSVYADRPVDVVKLDFDTDGEDESELEKVPQYNITDGRKPRPAFVEEYEANDHSSAAAYVHAIHGRQRPGEPDRDTDQHGNAYPTNADGEG
jgi:hypothetical protein